VTSVHLKTKQDLCNSGKCVVKLDSARTTSRATSLEFFAVKALLAQLTEQTSGWEYQFLVFGLNSSQSTLYSVAKLPPSFSFDC
jgi:hypothetical protein